MNGRNKLLYREKDVTASITAALPEDGVYYEEWSESESSKVSHQNYYLGLTNQVEGVSFWYQRETDADIQLMERFNDLAEKWEKDTRFFSSINDIIIHPAHLQIIAMGPQAVPLILNRMKQKPGLWFWALHFITGQHPVTEDIKGNTKAMTEAWLDWGHINGHC
jgi:hypothetical protein